MALFSTEKEIDNTESQIVSGKYGKEKVFKNKTDYFIPVTMEKNNILSLFFSLDFLLPFAFASPLLKANITRDKWNK